MLLFRSEEHIGRWCAQWGQPFGAVMTLEQQWQLASAWFTEDRSRREWRRRTIGEAEELFRSIGLTGGFWSLS